MKKEVKLLRRKAVNSLILSIEHFNRPSDRGRVEAVLLFLDHGLEMLLKSAILHRSGKIRERRAKQTIGFDECVRRSLSDGTIKFITEEQALVLQTINSLRDAAQHHLLDISEQHLYLQAQAGLTLFRDLFKKVFSEDIHDVVGTRVLPLSTTPPTDIATLFDTEVQEIARLLRPGSRRRIEANSKLRALAIMDGAIRGEKLQPGESELRRLANDVRQGKAWGDIFQGVASINMTAKGYGPSIDLRITKKEGIPVTYVPEGTPGAAVVAVKRVDELGFYNLGRDQLAEKVGLTGPKTTAMIRYLNLHSDPDCYKQIVIGSTKFNRYSQRAITKIQEALQKHSIESIWQAYRGGRKKKN